MNRKKMVIVGNAKVISWRNLASRFNKYTDLVNSANKVIRFNHTNNYLKGTGSKADVLSIVNVGTPAVEMSYKYHINSHSRFDNITLIKDDQFVAP